MADIKDLKNTLISMIKSFNLDIDLSKVTFEKKSKNKIICKYNTATLLTLKKQTLTCECLTVTINNVTQVNKKIKNIIVRQDRYNQNVKKFQIIYNDLSNMLRELSDNTICSVSLKGMNVNKDGNSAVISYYANSIYGKTNYVLSLKVQIDDIIEECAAQIVRNLCVNYKVTNFNDKYRNMVCSAVRECLNTIDPQKKYIKPPNTTFYKEALIDMAQCFVEPESLSGSVKNGHIITVKIKGETFTYDADQNTVKCNGTKAARKMVDTLSKNYNRISNIVKAYPQMRIQVISTGKVTISMLGTYKNKPLYIKESFSSMSDLPDETQISKLIESKKKDITEEIKAHARALLETVSKSNSYKNILAIEICNLVKKNENNMTAPMISKILRGNKITSEYKFNYTPACGCFAYIKDEDVSNAIKDLTKLDVLKPQTVRGTYGSFIVYTQGNVSPEFLTKDNEKAPDSYADYRDTDWVKLINNQINIPKNDSEQLLVLEQKNVVCRYPELVKEFAKGRPEFWLDYAEIMYAMEEAGIRKKYWKKVITLI